MAKKKVYATSMDQWNKVQMLRKLLNSGVPIPAVEARCRKEGVDPDWILKADDEDNGIEVVLKEIETAASLTSSSLFHLNEEGDVEFRGGTNNNADKVLPALVKMLVATVKRRGALDVKTGQGTFWAAPLADLRDALGSLRAVAYARDLYRSTCPNNDDDKDAAAGSDPNSTAVHMDVDINGDEVRCKRKPFLEYLNSLGVRPPGKHESLDINVIPGLDDLITLIERTSPRSSTHDEEEENDLVPSFSFDNLADLFRPGEKVVARNAFGTGVDALCQVNWSRYEQGKTLGGIVRRFVLQMQFVVAIGGDPEQGGFMLADFVETLFEFENRRSIHDLPFQPVSILPSATREAVLESARRRGVMYQRTAMGAHFLGYVKGSFYAKSSGASRAGGGGDGSGSRHPSASMRSDGRIMVDIAGSYEAGHSVSTGYDGMVLAMQYKIKEYNVYMRQQRQASNVAQNRANAGSSTSATATAITTTTTSADQDSGILLLRTIPDYLLELTWPALTGFSFTSKTWGDVLVDGLLEIDFAESTFDQLVLPPARKRMIKALVRHSSDSFHDIIRGKGEGSVFLLYGPPGCGKTLTAEAMSEMLHRPLYSVSLGQLGTTPAELETRLGEILDLCSRWDALILLDEADIFLEKRSRSGSLERNAMVSVMLRLVEYFQGVLFLTSNRVEALDPAFKTRITLALRYEALDATARAQVWRNLLNASGQGALLENGSLQIDPLAAHELNGREIKNCIRLALALAAEDATPLRQDMLLETVELLRDFNEKMNTAEAY